ncbi:hypothetical protein ACB092_03G061000 [Castanea dentata]
MPLPYLSSALHNFKRIQKGIAWTNGILPYKFMVFNVWQDWIIGLLAQLVRDWVGWDRLLVYYINKFVVTNAVKDISLALGIGDQTSKANTQKVMSLRKPLDR